jgi:polysaccharide biosynthesis transport protein
VTDSASGAAQQRELMDYLRTLRRRKWYVIGSTILVAALAVAFSVSQAKVYQARAQVVLSRQDIASLITGTQNPSLTEDPVRYAQTQATIAQSAAVAKLALSDARLAGRTVSAFLRESSVTPNATADVLDFSVQDHNRADAARLVNAYADAFVAYKVQLNTNALLTARLQLKQQLSRLKVLGLNHSPAYQHLANSEQQLHTMQLLQLRDNVLSRARAGRQVKPTPTRDGVLGLGFGLLIGLGLAFAAEALDRRVRTVEEVEEALELPLLARIPVPPRRHRGGIAMIDEPSSAYSEAIRRLATSIVFANPDAPPRMLMFTSAIQQEGKSTTLANLGVALAAIGNRVVLVDLDLRRPTLASLFSVHRLTGLTDVAVGRASLDEALFPVNLPDLNQAATSLDTSEPAPTGSLHLLQTGPLPLSPGEFVASEALVTRVLAPLRKQADYVLVDSPPVCVVADAIRLASRMDALVAVTRVGFANRPALNDLRRQLADARAPSLGVVVADASLPAAARYARYAGYVQNGSYGAPSRNGKRDSKSPSRRISA